MFQRALSFWRNFFAQYGLLTAGVIAGGVGLLVIASVVLTIVSRRREPGEPGA
jgi:hypothetical protein